MWVEQAKTTEYGADGPVMTGSGRFRQLDAESDIVVAQWGNGRWGYHLSDGARVLADYPTEQAARDALAEALGVHTFAVGDGSTPAEKAVTRKRTGTP